MTEQHINELKQENIKWWINHFVSHKKDFIIWETPKGGIVPVSLEGNCSVPFDFKRICDSTNYRNILSNLSLSFIK